MNREEAESIAERSIEDLIDVISAFRNDDPAALREAYSRFLNNVDATCSIQIEDLS